MQQSVIQGHEVKPQFYDSNALSVMLGVNRTTLTRMIHRGQLPKPVRVGSNRIAYPRDMVDAYIDQLREDGRAGFEQWDERRKVREANKAAEADDTEYKLEKYT